MRKYFTYKYILLYGILLITAGFYLNYFIPKPSNQTETSLTADYVTPTVAPTPVIDVGSNAGAIFVRNAAIVIGDSTKDLIEKFGRPARIAVTEFDYTYYIYNNDYKKLLFVAIREDQVIGFYTDSLDFKYQGIGYGATLEQINQLLKESFSLSDVLTKTLSGYHVSILMDTLNTDKTVGIYVMSDSSEARDFNPKVITSEEQLVYDLTNSVRARVGLSPLSWSSSAGQAARKHSENMAANHFFGHNDPSLRSPGDRLNSEGIFYQKCGENIIAGYDNAILACHGWYNSETHRKNLLSERFRYLGVGFAYDKDSVYKTYITQNFYR